MEEWGEVLRSLAPPPLATIVLEGRNQTVYNRHQSCLPQYGIVSPARVCDACYYTL